MSKNIYIQEQKSIPHIKAIYTNESVAKLKEEFDYSSPMAIPKILKVCLNMGIGEAVQDQKKVADFQRDLTLIAGQKALITRARKSIAGFKVREGMMLGVKVTLRRDKMWHFLEKFCSITLPRERSFRGFSVKSFDGKGNFSCGIREHISFLEIDYDKISAVNGVDINIVTTAKTDKEAMVLLKSLGFPFIN